MEYEECLQNILPSYFPTFQNLRLGSINLATAADDGPEGAAAAWKPIEGRVVDKDYAATFDRYRLLQSAVDTRADMKGYIRQLLLERVGETSPWSAALLASDFKLVALVHEPEDGAFGLVICQMATAVHQRSMTPELKRVMEQIVQNMSMTA